MQHNKIVSKRTDTTNQLIEAKDTQMIQIVMANDKKIDKLLASNATTKARFITEKKKAIESTLALKNTEISMLTMARDKDFDKMLEIMNDQISMFHSAVLVFQTTSDSTCRFTGCARGAATYIAITSRNAVPWYQIRACHDNEE